MAYAATISRTSPTCFVFLLDHSTSMKYALNGTSSKAAFLCDVVNKALYQLIVSCSRADGVRDYFHVGVIGYSGYQRGQGTATTALGNALTGELVHPIRHLADHPLRVERRMQRSVEEGGRVTSLPIAFPIWIDPVSSGWTGMCAGLRLVHSTLADWCRSYPRGYPPTVLHVTDGHPTDGDPRPLADAVRQVATEDGPCLLYNLHLDRGTGASCAFPGDESSLPDRYAATLFRMSSVLPDAIFAAAQRRGLPVEPGARGFVYNADLSAIVDFFDLGTRAGQNR